MATSNPRLTRLGWGVLAAAGSVLLALPFGGTGTARTAAADPKAEFAAVVRPFFRRYCLGCHGAASKKGGLDLERFSSPGQARADLEPWRRVV
jgi:hypothetical protein